MVDKTITELPEITIPDNTDVFAIVDVDTDITKKITYGNIGSNISIPSSQVSNFESSVADNGSVAANTAKVSYPGDADATELNILDGALITTTELNYSSGVSSSIQTQVDAKFNVTGGTLTGSANAADHGNGSGAEITNTVYSTGSIPPTAADTTEGTIFVQYAA